MSAWGDGAEFDALMKMRKRELRLLLDSPRVHADDAVNRAPETQGCYAIWKRGLVRPLYIGESENLKNRVHQHFVAAHPTQFREWLAKNTQVKELDSESVPNATAKA